MILRCSRTFAGSQGNLAKSGHRGRGGGLGRVTRCPCQTAVPGCGRGDIGCNRARLTAGSGTVRTCRSHPARASGNPARSGHRGRRGDPDGAPLFFCPPCRRVPHWSRPARASAGGRSRHRCSRTLWPGNAVPCQTAVPGSGRGETSVAIERGLQRAQAPSGRADRVQRAQAETVQEAATVEEAAALMERLYFRCPPCRRVPHGTCSIRLRPGRDIGCNRARLTAGSCTGQDAPIASSARKRKPCRTRPPRKRQRP